MDELVKAALAKWPNVPDCYGWLALDLRGQWRLGAERQTVTNAAMNAFIGRNYSCDQAGRWLFQNGPQRVFVALDYTPWVWRLMPTEGAFGLQNHIGTSVTHPDRIWLDDLGRFLITAAGMTGVLHDHDAALMLELLVDHKLAPIEDDQMLALLERDQEIGQQLQVRWAAGSLLPLESLQSQAVAERFHFDPAPSSEPTTSGRGLRAD